MSGSSGNRDLVLARSIGVKLTIAFLVLSIIPVSIVAYYNLTQSWDEVAQATRENLVELSRGTAHGVEQLIIENQRTSATLAGEPVVVEFLAASEEEREALAPQVYQTLQKLRRYSP